MTRKPLLTISAEAASAPAGSFEFGEDLFATLFQASSDAIAISRASDGRLVHVNDAFLRMLGYRREEVIGRTTAELDLWVDPAQRAAWVEELMARRSVGSMELRLRAKDGQERVVEASAQLIDYGGETCILAVDRDVTERTAAEVALRESEKRFRLLSDSAFEAIAIHADGRVIQANRAFAEMFRLDPDQVVGDEVLERTAPESRETVMEHIGSGSEEAYSIGAIRADGTRFEAEVAGRNIPYHGRTVRVTAIRDITERKHAEAQLHQALEREREATDRLRSLDEMKNTFLQAVSHDMRTPLASILGTALTLDRDDVRLSEEVGRDLLHRLAANARKLDRILSDLLDLDRLTRGLIEPLRARTDVAGLVRRVVADTDAARDRSVRVEAEPLVASVDAPKIERIVENLLVNSVKHTPAGTALWVRVQREEDGVLIAVEDDGPGIPAELREAIFEPFRQGPNAPAYDPGVGIGLSLVARFAELHGGRAWVQERAGGGASFRVLLPHCT